MSGISDRYRRFVSNGSPVATGFVAVADAWACTNPSAGRGLTVGFKHARLLRDVLRGAAGDPAEVVRETDRRTEAEVAPWYHAQIALDRTRVAEIEALRDGRVPPPPADGLARDIQSLFAAMTASADLFRAAIEYVATITPAQDILKRPEIAEGIRTARAAAKGPPPPLPGPTRAQLLDIVGTAA
jgi:flavin-dependent dehydrogenase